MFVCNGLGLQPCKIVPQKQMYCNTRKQRSLMDAEISGYILTFMKLKVSLAVHRTVAQLWVRVQPAQKENNRNPKITVVPGTSCFIGFEQKVSNTNGFFSQQTVRFSYIMQILQRTCNKHRFIFHRIQHGFFRSREHPFLWEVAVDHLP